MSEPIFQAELNTEQGDQSQFDEEALLARRRTYVLGATAVGIVILAILAIPWRDYVQNLLNVLNQVPAVDLESASEQDEQLLVRVRDICDKHLKMLRSSRI